MMIDYADVEHMESRRQKMETYLANLAEPLRAKGMKVRAQVLVLEEPAANIIDYLAQNPCELLVMATRGKSRFNRTILGSVTENIIHGVKTTPMLLVGGED